MKRRLSRKSRQKQKKFLIISSLSLLLFLCVGYAAFSTQLSIKATGHIKQKTASGMLRELCHTEVGDGLYKDIYEEGKCTYKGSNPNNYIEFNDEMWRIVSITSDDTIKIIKNDVIEGDFFYYEITEELNNYIQKIEKNKITNNNWHNLNKSEARVEFNLDLDKLIVEENKNIVTGEIGIITMGEYLRANSNNIDCGNDKLMIDNEEICTSTNWMNFSNDIMWWLNYYTHNDQCLQYVVGAGCVQDFDEYRAWANIRPALYLSSNITLSGTGSETDPYIITN